MFFLILTFSANRAFPHTKTYFKPFFILHLLFTDDSHIFYIDNFY